MAKDSGEFWERLEGESDAVYSAFSYYRDLGISRTLKRAACAYYSERGYQGATEELPTTSQVQRFKKWSARWLWVARCEAFDAEESRLRMLKMQHRRIETAEHHWNIGALTLNRVAAALQNAAAFGEDLPLRSLPQFMREGSAIQRLALGEATANVEVQGTVRRGREEQDREWLRNKPVEELEELVMRAGLYSEDQWEYQGLEIYGDKGNDDDEAL